MCSSTNTLNSVLMSNIHDISTYKLAASCRIQCFIFPFMNIVFFFQQYEQIDFAELLTSKVAFVMIWCEAGPLNVWITEYLKHNGSLLMASSRRSVLCRISSLKSPAPAAVGSQSTDGMRNTNLDVVPLHLTCHGAEVWVTQFYFSLRLVARTAAICHRAGESHKHF